MADPRLEQERILPRLQRILDVVSSWAGRAPAARAQNVPNVDDLPDVDAVKTAVKTAAGVVIAAAADAASRSLAGASQALASSADSDGDADADRAHGSAAGSGRRHARATEPIWHMVTGQDERLPLPGLPPSVSRATGPGPGDAAASHAPGTLASARAGESMTTAVGMGHMSGIRAAQSASGSSAAVAGVDAMSDGIGTSPGPARDAAAPAQDAAVLQPLLGQDTPPLFGRATSTGRAATASDTGAHATRAPGPHGAAGAAAPTGAPGPAPAPWRAAGRAAEPTPVPGHLSTLTGTVPGSLLHPPDLLGAGERGLARATPRSVPAEPQPDRPGALPAPAGADGASPGDLAAGHAAGPSADGSAGSGVEHGIDRAFGRSELEEELADVLEHAAREAGVDLS